MNGLKQEWGEEVLVLQVNIQDQESKSLIERLEAQFTPTFILFDSDGQERWRAVGQLDAEEVKAQVEALSSSALSAGALDAGGQDASRQDGSP